MIKKIVIISAIVFCISCDSAWKRSAYISVPLPEGIAKVHMAVFDGDWGSENLLMTTQLMTTNSDVMVPVGNDLIFLFVAENYAGEGEYIKVLPNIVVSSNGKTNLDTVVLVRFDENGDETLLDPIQINQNTDLNRLQWIDVGATQYNIMYFPEMPEDAIVIGTANTNYYNFTGSEQNGQYAVSCYYSFFGIESIMSNDNWVSFD